MGFLIRLIVNAIAIWLTAFFLAGVTLTEGETPLEQVLVVGVVALVFTLVNAIVKPVVKLLTLPLTILTLGLFTLVVNALMVMLTSWITGFADWGMAVDGFWWALGAGLVISIVTGLLNLFLPDKR